MTYQVSREQIIEAALGLKGYKFRHQARGEDNSIDCVGFLVLIGRAINYPEIFDVKGYRRQPNSELLYETLCKNADEIDLSQAKRGDIYLLRMKSKLPNHVALRLSDETDLKRGIEPQLIHAYSPMFGKGKVIIEPVTRWQKYFHTAFQIKGVID